MKKLLLLCALFAASSMFVSAAMPESTEDEIYMIVEEMPAFADGGQAGLFKYISDNLVYPSEARANEIEGRVMLQFVVEKDGTISNVKVMRSSNDESLDNEAIRLVKSMPKWNPGKQGGKAVRVKYTLPVSFVL